MKKLLVSLIAIVCLQLAVSSYAQVPGIINYQGRIVDNSTNFNGTGSFEFALVNPVGTTTYWSNDGTAVGRPALAVSLTVTKGLYSVLLGDTTLTNMAAIPVTVFTNADVRLRVWFNDGVTGFQQLSPDQRIAAVGFALMSANVPDGSITSNKIAAGAVGPSALGVGLMTASDISNFVAAAVAGATNAPAGAATFGSLYVGSLKDAYLAVPTNIVAANIGSATFNNTYYLTNMAFMVSTYPSFAGVGMLSAWKATNAAYYVTELSSPYYGQTFVIGKGAAPTTLTNINSALWWTTNGLGGQWHSSFASGSTNMVSPFSVTPNGQTNIDEGMTLPPVITGLTNGLNSFLLQTNANFINVKSFGAVGNGIADDSVAVQSADGAAYSNGQTVYFPAGNYYCSSNLSQRASWRGEGGILDNFCQPACAGAGVQTYLTCSATLTGVFISARLPGARISYMGLWGNNTYLKTHNPPDYTDTVNAVYSGTVGVYQYQAQQILDGCWIAGFDTGVFMNYTEVANSLSRCRFASNNISIITQSGSGDNVIDRCFFAGDFYENILNYGYDTYIISPAADVIKASPFIIDNGGRLRITGGDIEPISPPNPTNGIIVTYGYGDSVDDMDFVGVHICAQCYPFVVRGGALSVRGIDSGTANTNMSIALVGEPSNFLCLDPQMSAPPRIDVGTFTAYTQYWAPSLAKGGSGHSTRQNGLDWWWYGTNYKISVSGTNITLHINDPTGGSNIDVNISTH